MSSEYRYIEAKQLEAGQEFGRMLRRWRELNNWTQYTAYKWAKEAGFEVMAPSTLSVFENGKAPKPRPESFFALAEVNRRLAAKDFSGVRTRALKDLISQAQPLVDDDGRAWGPAEFWSCHLGLLPVPSATVRSGGQPLLHPPPAGPAKQRQTFQAVLAGFESYTPEQLEGLWDGEAWLPQRWLEEWSSKTGAS